MTSLQANTLFEALQSKAWPMNARTVVDGFGTCLGATYDRGTPRLAVYPKPYAQLTKQINEAIREHLSAFYYKKKKAGERKKPPEPSKPLYNRVVTAKAIASISDNRIERAYAIFLEHISPKQS